MAKYERVLPRDLFNEAKLLKCLGRLIMLIHDDFIPELSFIHDDPDKGFSIRQDSGSGDLYCCNLRIIADGRAMRFTASYNSKDAYPLLVSSPRQGEVGVFDEDGNFTADFRRFVARWCDPSGRKGAWRGWEHTPVDQLEPGAGGPAGIPQPE